MGIHDEQHGCEDEAATRTDKRPERADTKAEQHECDDSRRCERIDHATVLVADPVNMW
jgi:hypothetical protein